MCRPRSREIRSVATAGQGGDVPPPWSAAHPYVNLYALARPAIATVTGNYRLTADGASADIRHIVLDFGGTAFPVLEGQTIGIVPPGVDANGRPHHVRLYSIASPREGERPRYNNVSLTVKRVTEDHDGKAVRGVASNYLCDLKKGDEVKVVGPYGTSFLMPNHPGSSLLMVCTGTGSAPMRAMTERRRRRIALKEGGTLMLFFGARAPAELPYFGPLQKLPKDFIDINFAFSRVEGQPSSTCRTGSAHVARTSCVSSATGTRTSTSAGSRAWSRVSTRRSATRSERRGRLGRAPAGVARAGPLPRRNLLTAEPR